MLRAGWHHPAKIDLPSCKAAKLPARNTDHAGPPRAANAAAWEPPPCKIWVREGGGGGSARASPMANRPRPSPGSSLTLRSHPSRFASPKATGRTR